MAHIAQLSGGIQPSSESASAADTTSHETTGGIQPSSESTSAVSTSTTPNPATQEQSTDYTKAKGSQFYRANVYHTQLMKRAQELSDVASITLRMEINGAMSTENLHFAELISKCRDELIDIGEHLKSQATKIKAAQNEFTAKQQQ